MMCVSRVSIALGGSWSQHRIWLKCLALCMNPCFILCISPQAFILYIWIHRAIYQQPISLNSSLSNKLILVVSFCPAKIVLYPLYLCACIVICLDLHIYHLKCSQNWKVKSPFENFSTKMGFLLFLSWSLKVTEVLTCSCFSLHESLLCLSHADAQREGWGQLHTDLQIVKMC